MEGIRTRADSHLDGKSGVGVFDCFDFVGEAGECALFEHDARRAPDLLEISFALEHRWRRCDA